MLNKDSSTRFGLIRHAQTVWNQDKMIQGQKDSVLTTAGRRQSCTWGQRLAVLPFDGILSSDLGRTLATAELINRVLKLPMKKTSRLREQIAHFGKISVRQAFNNRNLIEDLFSVYRKEVPELKL